MWHNHPFSQQNKATEREMGVGIGADMEGGGGGGYFDLLQLDLNPQPLSS